MQIQSVKHPRPHALWRPQEGERYFMILGDGHIRELPWHGTPVDYDAWQFGNCFRQRQDAQQAREAMHTLLQKELWAAGGSGPPMDKETLIEAMKARLRTLLPYYENKDENEYFYLARDADLTRAAESLADFWGATAHQA